ncbi:uncharacterized protein LOC119735385 [Patiria miniata]|uniref:Uncharacterized protein n=1 Tax=Patiria miniata TaxID=46514 RepID=A0A914ANJ5_PATMI|nr:uncharacterized protein LOC119735385 [Patiria miniata]
MSIAVGVTVALLLVLVAAIVFWRRWKNNIPPDGNQPVVHYARTGTDRPTVSVSAVLNTVVGPSGNRAMETVHLADPQEQSDVPSTGNQQPAANFQVVHTYEDRSFIITPPLEAQAIRIVPPTQYADIDNYLISSPIETSPLFRYNAPSLWEEGHSLDGLEEEGRMEWAPPRPLRGNPILSPVRDWQM